MRITDITTQQNRGSMDGMNYFLETHNSSSQRNNGGLPSGQKNVGEPFPQVFDIPSIELLYKYRYHIIIIGSVVQILLYLLYGLKVIH